jgi:ribonuclease E
VAKPQLVKSSRETEPPEVIAIEMTPEEQDVYALMGISPLVRLNRQIKNPKSVILSVVLPGEGNQTQTSDEPPLESSTSVPVLSLASDEAEIPEDEAEIPEREFATLPDQAPRSDKVQVPENVLVTQPDEPSVTELSVDPAQTDESDSSRPIVRRRRRRSSAADSED